MDITPDHIDAIERANKSLENLAGNDVDAIEVKSVETKEAPFLAKIVSKLSPMVGNLMEQHIVELLDQDVPEGHSWMRQDPGFPDAILVDDQVKALTSTGYEIKAWYVLSTEITGRFKESQNLLEGKNINVAVVAWCMSNMIFGKPKILGVLTVSGKELAKSRDAHYHQPPEYLTIEPQDTTARTANLQQSNVNGYKLQVAESDADVLKVEREKYAKQGAKLEPQTPAGQAESSRLMAALEYRLDTNFAKIDRVGNPDVEAFKKKIMASKYLGKSFAQWKTVFKNLEAKDEAKRLAAEEVIVSLYGQMLTEEPQTEIVVESPGAQ